MVVSVLVWLYAKLLADRARIAAIAAKICMFFICYCCYNTPFVRINVEWGDYNNAGGALKPRICSIRLLMRISEKGVESSASAAK